MKSKYMVACVGAVLIALLIALNVKPKLPATVVILSWDFDKIVLWIDETKEDSDYLRVRSSGATMLHDIARYRKHVSKKDTDYDKFERLISYYIEQGGDPHSKNNHGETAYEVALKYDVQIAEMIKRKTDLQSKVKEENRGQGGMAVP